MQRNLPDAVAIPYAIMALGDTLRGIFPAGQTFPNWDEFVKELNPEFTPHTADLAFIPHVTAVSYRAWRTAHIDVSDPVRVLWAHLVGPRRPAASKPPPHTNSLPLSQHYRAYLRG